MVYYYYKKKHGGVLKHLNGELKEYPYLGMGCKYKKAPVMFCKAIYYRSPVSKPFMVMDNKPTIQSEKCNPKLLFFL